MRMYQAAYKSLKELGNPTHVSGMHEFIVNNNYFFVFGANDPARVLGVCLDRRTKGVFITKPEKPQLFYRHALATCGILELPREKCGKCVAH